MPHRLEPDREQRGRDLLARRHQYISLASARRFAQFGRELEQPIGFTSHRGYDHDDSVAGVAHSDDAMGDRLDSFDRTDRSATVFLNDQSHQNDPISPENGVIDYYDRKMDCKPVPVLRAGDWLGS